MVLRDDLAAYLHSRYKNDGITEQEVENAIRVITQRTGGSLYEENRHTTGLLKDGFSLKRQDATSKRVPPPHPSTTATTLKSSITNSSCLLS